MKAKALYTILSAKYRDGEVIFVDQINFPEGKTKQAVSALKNFEQFSKKHNALAIAMSGKNRETERAFKNLGNVEVFEARNLDPVTLLKYKYLVIENPESAIKSFPKMKHAKS